MGKTIMKSEHDLAARWRFRLRRTLLLAGVALGTLALPAHAITREPIPVVATFSILGDMVREVGGERVRITTIVGPNMDAHRFEPTPQDVKALKEARVLVLNGLDFEAWLPRLLQASGFEGRKVLATEGISVRHFAEGGAHVHGHDAAGSDAAGHQPAQGGHDHASQAPAGGKIESHASHDHSDHDVDPHAWQDLSNGVIYVRNIAAGLSKADPRNAGYYEGRANSYIARIKTLDNEIRTALAAIPPEQRRVITAHDSFGYFGAAYGVEFVPLAGLSNEAEPSAKEMARIINKAREAKVGGIFVENMSSPALAQQVARETGALMGGTLYSDALGPADQPAATYLGMMSWNAGRLVYVLKQKSS